LALRRPQLPEDLPQPDRDRVRAAGRPYCAALALKLDEARRGSAGLVARYPTARGVHFLYGLVDLRPRRTTGPT
jgi:hypothetical protein